MLFAATAAAFAAFEMEVIKTLAFDQSSAIDASADVLDRPLVRSGVSEAISKLVMERAISAEAAAQLKAANLNVDADLQASASLMTENPLFRSRFSQAVGQLHSYVLTDRTVVPAVEIGPFIEQLRADAASVDPLYAQAIVVPENSRLEVPLDGLPDFTGLRALIDRREQQVAVVALAATLLAFAVYPGRARLLRRAALTVCSCAVLHAAAVVMLPVAADSITKGSYPIATEVLRALLARLIAPAGVLLAVGIGAWVLANRLRRWQPHKNAQAGAEAFLTPEQPQVSYGVREAPAQPPRPTRERQSFPTAPASAAALAPPRGSPPLRPVAHMPQAAVDYATPPTASHYAPPPPNHHGYAAPPHNPHVAPPNQHPAPHPPPTQHPAPHPVHTRHAGPSHPASPHHQQRPPSRSAPPTPQVGWVTNPPASGASAAVPRPVPSAQRLAAAATAAAEPVPNGTQAAPWPDPARVSRIGAEGDSPAALHALSGLPTIRRDA